MYTLRQIIEAVDAEIAVEGEDFVYHTESGFCQYVEDGSPSCLIGRALHRLGTPVDALAAYDNMLEANISNANARYNILDDEAELFALVVQQWQDYHMTWGDARDHGLSRVLRARS